MTPDTPEPEAHLRALHRHLPSGTVIPSFYAGCSTCPARPAEHLLEVCTHVQGQTLMQPCAPAPVAPIDGQHEELADIKSQYGREGEEPK